MIQQAPSHKVLSVCVSQCRMSLFPGRLTDTSLCTCQGQPGELAAAAPALLECDLTGNLLPEWPAVAAVLRELPRLLVLNLTASRLAPPRAGLATPGSSSALRTLVLNRCCIRRWDEVRLLIVCCFHLTQIVMENMLLQATILYESGAKVVVPLFGRC